MKPRTLSTMDLRKAERHLTRSCKVMEKLVALHGECDMPDTTFRPFQTLVTSIISQQLSTKAAETIKNRILEVVPTFTPQGFLSVSHQVLREAGLSMAKAKYIIQLATRVNEGRLDFNVLRRQSDAEVIAALTDLPGIGRWTSEMFLMSALNRPDILASGDAGLQRAARLLYGDSVDLDSVGQRWKPYRSVASWYLWKHLDSN